MSYVTKYISHPDVKVPNTIHKHIKEVHSLFLEAGFTQTSDVGQYDVTAPSLDYDYEPFLSSTSYGSWSDVGRIVFDFPDYYDDDGCELKLKIGLVFSVIKNTAYSSATLSDVSLRFHMRFFITTHTNGESQVVSPYQLFNHGYYMSHATNDVANKGLGSTNSALNSIVAYDKKAKSLYINICPYYRWGYNANSGYSSLFFMIGTMAIDGKGVFYKGEDCTFMFAAPYLSTASAAISSAQITWNRLSPTGYNTADIPNTPLNLAANALVDGNAYYQNFYTQTKMSGYVSPSKNILIAHKDFVVSHNNIVKIYQDGEYMGDFATVDLFTYSRTYMATDTSSNYRFLVRVNTDDK